MRSLFSSSGTTTLNKISSGESCCSYKENIRSEGRKRFTIAHELGHYMLHRAEMDEFVCTSIVREQLYQWRYRK
jgi:Zn-dependent peptidase ImmA (M78 family)